MQLSFLCAEEAVQAGPDEVADGDLGAGALLTASSPIVGTQLWDLCDVWDVEPGDDATYEPIETDIPLLVVTGQFDQITPPSYGEEVAAAATNAWYVEIPGVGHAPLTNVGPCGVELLGVFLDDPGTEPTVACELTGVPFYSPEDIAEFEAAAGASTTSTTSP